jgi:hypothetical protein
MTSYRTFAIAVGAAVLLAVVLLAGFLLISPTGDVAARTVSADFVSQLKNVPLTAETEDIRAAIERYYKPYVTEELLNQWLADPQSAPGRETSSPWPDRIFIKQVVPQGETYVINADVLYMTSVEEATSEEDASGVVVVTIFLVPTNDGWRIAAYHELFGEELDESATTTNEDLRG